MVKNETGRGSKISLCRSHCGVVGFGLSPCYVIKGAEVNSWRGPIIVGIYNC